MKTLFLGLDLGTTAVKGVVVSAAGEVLASARFERHPAFPRPGWVEMDPEADWWGAALEVIRRLSAQLGSRVADILGLGVCGLVPCLGLFDEEGRALRPAILYSDNRALAELARVRQHNGQDLTAEALVPKLLWVQAHEPQLFSRAHVVLSAHQYVVRRLTGQSWMDYDTASILGGIFRAGAKVYDWEALAALGLPAAIWPELRPAVAAAGTLTRQAAALTGLVEGTSVLVGSGDTFPNIIGCGAVEPGDAMLALGTTALMTLSVRPLLESAMGPHFDDGSGRASVAWGANVLAGGQLADWYSSQFARLDCGPQGTDWFARLEELAQGVPPGADGLLALPHWLGRRSPLPNPGLRGALIGLTPAHTPGHLYRALLEAVAYNLRQGLDPLRGEVRRAVATGGGAACALWRQILADVLELEVEYYPAASGALGMAFLAAWASGAVHEFDAVKREWLGAGLRARPAPAAVQRYRSGYAAYRRVEAVLETVYGSNDLGEKG